MLKELGDFMGGSLLWSATTLLYLMAIYPVQVEI